MAGNVARMGGGKGGATKATGVTPRLLSGWTHATTAEQLAAIHQLQILDTKALVRLKGYLLRSPPTHANQLAPVST